jgi:bacterioferritin
VAPTPEGKSMNKPNTKETFLSDVKTLRARARKSIADGAVTAEYQGDPKKTVEILQAVLATELVCVLRYTQHSIAAAGISSQGVKASQFVAGENLVDMIKENLIAERIAVEHYSELIRYFGDRDPGTRHMLEGILVVEEEHADDMHDLLIAHEGTPMIEDK